MRWLTGPQQIAEVKAKFPSLKLIHDLGWLIIWQGELRSFSATYTVRFFWQRWWPTSWGFRGSNLAPSITIIKPKLEHPSGRRIPHIYTDGAKISLCVFDPENDDDWNPSQSIADTIIPYTIQWLGSYELWLVTEEWPAPGRHPERRPICSEKAKPSSESLDQPARSIDADFAKIGQKTGTFASSVLMGAESEESFRWLSWQNWNDAISKETVLRAIST